MIVNAINTPQPEQLDESVFAVRTLNGILGQDFTNKHGRKWVRITLPDQTTAMQLSEPISSAKAIKWFKENLQDRIENFVFSTIADSQFVHLVISEPLVVNFRSASDHRNAGGIATSFCRFPHMYLKMQESPLDIRTKARVLLVGPGMIIPRDYGETALSDRETVYFPQLSELAYLYPEAHMVVMNKADDVLDELRRLKSKARINFSGHFSSDALTKRNTFSRNAEKYVQLAEIFKSKLNPPSKLAVIAGDIAETELKSRFDVIVATKVIGFIPMQNDVKTAEEGKTVAVKTLCHLFSALSAGGKLYVDEEAMQNLAKASNMDLDQLLEEVRTKGNLTSISRQVIPHDATKKVDPDLYYLESAITTNGYVRGVRTDNIYEFTVKS